MKPTDRQPPSPLFPEIKGKLGFGLMRLPMCGDVCPQHLDIPALLRQAAEAFEV